MIFYIINMYISIIYNYNYYFVSVAQGVWYPTVLNCSATTGHMLFVIFNKLCI